MSMISQIFEVSDQINNGRTLSDILAHTMTEVGELAEEVIIAQGRSYKEAGKDGIIGEAVDVIICAIDIIRQTDPIITEAELMSVVRSKLMKWELTAGLSQRKGDLP